MKARTQWLALSSIAAIVLAGAITYGAISFVNYQQRQSAPSTVKTITATVRASGPRVVFRNTATGQGYGLVASVPLDNPAAPRVVTDRACDRVYETEQDIACLRTNRGVVTTFEAVVTDASGKQLASWALPGIPSRTRISQDSRFVASTAFITGMSYATVGFSTQTVIKGADGSDYGHLEDFTTLIDGDRLTAIDRNFWGVTFGADADTFYATAASGGKTWLVRGDLRARTMMSVRENAECPSLSPDGLHVAYKKKVSSGPDSRWAIAVLDLATDQETVLSEKHSVDDQVEWLDDTTLLYGLVNAKVAGDSDVWSIPIDDGSAPVVYIKHAWSPSVVR
ncbi:MAG: hypothetical protein ABI275_08855 [Terrimesophilobacter sp.]